MLPPDEQTLGISLAEFLKMARSKNGGDRRSQRLGIRNVGGELRVRPNPILDFTERSPVHYPV